MFTKAAARSRCCQCRCATCTGTSAWPYIVPDACCRCTQVKPVPLRYLHQHQGLLDEFRNISHWPKHLLVHYRFKSQHPVDLDRGLYVVFAAGA